MQSSENKGPSGFIEINGHVCVVDYGKIFFEGTRVGTIADSGIIKGTKAPLGNTMGEKPIDEVTGCTFRGIDSNGIELILPNKTDGPSGTLKYNGAQFNVIHGRVVTDDHQLIGEFDDQGIFYIRDLARRLPRRQLDESTQLTTIFVGRNSQGKSWRYEFVRPMHKKDKSYSQNEIIRYFENFDELSSPQKKFVMQSLQLWSSCGLLQLVRKNVGTQALGNVRHGAAGATGVYSGNATLDREEFEKEIVLLKQYGLLPTFATRIKPYCEVRLNMVVAHEFGHQLEFILSQSARERIADLYYAGLKRSEKLFPLPAKYEGTSELVPHDKADKRVFISGYARQSEFEYFAECAAAFSVSEGRDKLRYIDPDIYKLLNELITNPQKMVWPDLAEKIIDLQSSLAIGKELDGSIV